MKRPLAQSGFTLIETLVAVTILAFAVVGPLFTAGRALIAAQIARDRLVASYLAQETVEYVRAMRDHAYLSYYRAGDANVSDDAWAEFTAGSGVASVARCATLSCQFDPSYSMQSGNSISTCSGNACKPLYLAGGIYTEQSGITGATLTPFTRTFTVAEDTAHDLSLVVTVSWNFHGTSYEVTVRDHLTPWQ